MAQFAQITYEVNQVGPCTLLPYFRSFTKSPLWKRMLIKPCLEMLKNNCLGSFTVGNKKIIIIIIIIIIVKKYIVTITRHIE